MILFCFVLINKLASRGQGWLEHHLERHTTFLPLAEDTTARNTVRNTATTHLPHRLPHRLPRRLRRSLQSSDSQTNAVLHLQHLQQHADELS